MVKFLEMNRVKAFVSGFWQAMDSRARKIILGLAAAVVVLLVCIVSGQSTQNVITNSSWQNPVPASSSVSSDPPMAPEAQLMVHVVGEVISPGVYRLPNNSRVLDAIFAAGGFTAQADQGSINLARLVNDGEQILVTVAGQTSGAGTNSQSALVNLNFADANQLDSLPGIGPTLAQRIIDYRRVNGGFTSLSDLGRVAGFGPSLIAKLTNSVTF